MPKPGTDLANRKEPEDIDLPDEPRPALPATVPQLGLVGLLFWVLWSYRDSDWKMLVPAVTAVSIAIVIFRVGNIRKITSKLLSIETGPAVEKANAATKRANKAAQEAKQMAAAASAAAEEAKQEVVLLEETIGRLREIGASLARISLDTLGRANISGEFPWSDKIRLRDDLREKLRRLEVPTEEITAADRPFQEMLRFQLAHRVAEAAKEACQVTRNGQMDHVVHGVPSQDRGLARLRFPVRAEAGPSSQDRRRLHRRGRRTLARRIRAL